MSDSPPSDPFSARLKTPEGAALLADRWIAELLGLPVDELWRPAETAQTLHQMLSAAAQSDRAEALLLERAEALLARWADEDRALGEVLPGPFAESALRLARRPHSPHQKLVLRVLDRDPVRQLIRALLIEALVEFGRKMAAPISTSRVGKGLGTLGSLAGAVGAGVLGAVGGELERQVERRAAEFADTALSRILHRIVEHASDPRHAREQAELRAALVEGILEVPVGELVAEVERADPRSLVAEARRTVAAWATRPGSRSELEEEIRIALEPFARRSVGEVLDELGMRAALEQGLRALLIERIRAFDWSGLFAALGAL